MVQRMQCIIRKLVERFEILWPTWAHHELIFAIEDILDFSMESFVDAKEVLWYFWAFALVGFMWHV
jgi:hypothetical protein